MSVEEMSGQMSFDGMPPTLSPEQHTTGFDGFARIREELGAIALGDMGQPTSWVFQDELHAQMPLPIRRELIDSYAVRQEDYLEAMSWHIERMDQQLYSLESTLAEAQKDPLTGLMSLPQFKGVLKRHVEFQQQLADIERFRPDQMRRRDLDRKGLIVLTIDLDGFKQVNDTYGHPAGDKVLIDAAHLMTESVRDQDHVCRSGGDEFLILLNDGIQAHDFVSIARRISTGLHEIDVDGKQGLVGASIGGASFDDGKSVEDLIQESDEAMYDDKARKSSRGF